MKQLRFTYWINVSENGCVSISGEHSLEDAERNFNMTIKRCTGSEYRVVLSKDGTIFTDKSRYQAEAALSYLKNNYPTYTNFRVGGTGEWDDPYYATMEKTLKVYDVHTKKIYSRMSEDEN